MSKQPRNFTKRTNTKQIKQLVKSEDEKFKTIVNMNGLSRRIRTILPPMSPNASFVIKRRYIANGATSGAIVISDLFNSWVVASTTILGHPIGRAYRLKKISILSPVTTQGTTVLLQMTPNSTESTSNSFNSMPEAYVDTSCSIDKPAFISLKPSEMSPFGSWHVVAQSATPNIIAVVCASGSVMDLTIEIIANNGADTTYSTVLVGATAGVSYARSILTNFAVIGFPSA
jgi:hypothetical protein